MRRSGMKIMSGLFALVGSLAYVLMLAILNGSIGHLVAIFIPLLGSIGVAKMLGASIAISYELIFALVIIFGLLRGVLKYIEQYSNHYIAFKILAVIRNKIFDRLRVLCPAKLETKQKGNIISMITADIETIEVFYAHTMSPIGIALIVSIAMSIFIGLVVSWYMSIVAICVYIILGIIMPVINSKSLGDDGVKYREQFSKFNGYFMDCIKGSKDVVMHCKGDEAKGKINAFSSDITTTSRKIKFKISLIEAIMGMLITLSTLAMFGVGLVLTSVSSLSPALMLVGVVALMSSLGPVLALSALPSGLNQTFASGERVLSLLEEKPVVIDIDNGEDFDFEELKLTDVNFSYNENSPVLRGINLSVNQGEIVAIKGKSGCGKSTILKLLLHFWEKDSGKMQFNGIDIDNINTESLKRNVAMVSQSTYIFDDTVSGNLRIAKNDATTDQIIQACKKASLHEFILTLSDGYETKVGSSGVALSAGETQRLGLARAFLSDCKLILLDEPTSSVDAINEGIILDSLRRNRGDRSVIIVSHRDSTLSVADRVYYIENGCMEGGQ